MSGYSPNGPPQGPGGPMYQPPGGAPRPVASVGQMPPGPGGLPQFAARPPGPFLAPGGPAPPSAPHSGPGQSLLPPGGLAPAPLSANSATSFAPQQGAVMLPGGPRPVMPPQPLSGPAGMAGAVRPPGPGGAFRGPGGAFPGPGGAFPGPGGQFPGVVGPPGGMPGPGGPPLRPGGPPAGQFPGSGVPGGLMPGPGGPGVRPLGPTPPAGFTGPPGGLVQPGGGPPGPPRPFVPGAGFPMPGGTPPPPLGVPPGPPFAGPPPLGPGPLPLGPGMQPPPTGFGVGAPGGFGAGPPGGFVGGPPGGFGGMPGGFDPNNGQFMERVETITMGSGGVGIHDNVDPAQLPRPIADQREHALAAQPLFDLCSCSASNMRLTVNGIPNSTALKARWALPIGLVVHPMADEQAGHTVPVVNLGAAGIVRCRRCRTYMNPFVQWTDGGRRFKCNVCAMLNEIPVEYYCNLDNNGRRRDWEERPEISSGTVEYVAPAEYMVRPPMPPVYFFVIDVSYTAVHSGMVKAAAAAIRACLKQLPGDERTMVGFITFDSTLHYYNLKASLTAPQMMVVTELEDPFVPLPDDLLVNLRESMHVVQALLDLLPNNFANTSIIDSATGPALQAAFLMTSHVGCKLLLFQAGVPSLGSGKVKNRENLAQYGTDREPALRNPEDQFFKRFAAECNRVQIAVDVFTFGAGQYMDLASLAAVPRFTCGELYHYPRFDAGRDGEKLHREVTHNLLRPTAWEAVMRVRCSKGLRVSSFHGHFFNRSTDLLAMPICDPDKAFAVQISLEENVVPSSVAFVQCALLYTNSNGERRIRVHTLSVPVVSDLSELYKGADAGALVCVMAKLAVEKSLQSRLDETRATLQAKVVAALREFRMLNASAMRAPNKMVFPETLKYLPLWTLGLLKTPAIRGGAKDVPPDERIAVGHDIMAASTESLLRMVHPDLYVLHDPAGPWGLEQQDRAIPLPSTAPLTMTTLSESGAYLLDNGRVFILWLGRLIAPQWCLEVFGAEPAALPLDGPGLVVEPGSDAHMSKRVNNVLRALRHNRPVHAQCHVVRQGSPVEVHVAPYFVEDRSQVAASYAEFMLTLHKGVLSNK